MNRIARKRVEMQRRRDLRGPASVVVQESEQDFQEYRERCERQEVYDAKLRSQGKLGVACSLDVLMANVSRIAENPEEYFLENDLDDLMENPEQVRYGGLGMCEFVYWAGKYAGKKPEVVSVVYRPSVEISVTGMIERARRNLAYEILKREGSHGAQFRMKVGDNYVSMSAIPIVGTRE